MVPIEPFSGTGGLRSRSCDRDGTKPGRLRKVVSPIMDILPNRSGLAPKPTGHLCGRARHFPRQSRVALGVFVRGWLSTAPTQEQHATGHRGYSGDPAAPTLPAPLRRTGTAPTRPSALAPRTEPRRPALAARAPNSSSLAPSPIEGAAHEPPSIPCPVPNGPRRGGGPLSEPGPSVRRCARRRS